MASFIDLDFHVHLTTAAGPDAEPPEVWCGHCQAYVRLRKIDDHVEAHGVELVGAQAPGGRRVAEQNFADSPKFQSGCAALIFTDGARPTGRAPARPGPYDDAGVSGS